MFHEYPKALCMDGDSEAEMVVVADAEQEAAKRAEGFRVYGEGRTIAEIEAAIVAPFVTVLESHAAAQVGAYNRLGEVAGLPKRKPGRPSKEATE